MISWDEEKRVQVLKDHHVDFEKVIDVFDDPFGIIYEDHAHSVDEQRGTIIGKTSVYGLVMVVFAAFEHGIRMITARRAEGWMIRIYEEQRRRY